MAFSLQAVAEHFSRMHNDEDLDDDDDINADVTRLLSILPLASIVVDSDGEVLTANSSAYNFGLVSNETVANERIAKAVNSVLESGKLKRFSLKTVTARDPMIEQMKNTSRSLIRSAGYIAGKDEDVPLIAVTATHYLHVTIGKLNEEHAVVLIEDVTEQKEFARMRDIFIENVSHQLLVPTTQLEQLIDILRSAQTPQEFRKNLESCAMASSHLHHLVDDLLLLLKAQEPIEPSDENCINITAIVRKCVESIQSDADAKSLTIHLVADADIMVNGQESALFTAIKKMLDNAIIYSSEQGTIGVQVSCSPDNNNVIIRVVDNGVGIVKQDQVHIFERFWRGAHSPEGGTGLGLAIVKHVALTHHGSVGVWSAPGKGATFSFIMPKSCNEE